MNAVAFSASDSSADYDSDDEPQEAMAARRGHVIPAAPAAPMPIEILSIFRRNGQMFYSVVMAGGEFAALSAWVASARNPRLVMEFLEALEDANSH
jgi:hypothetical protein